MSFPVVLLLALALLQSTPSAPTKDALALLQEVGQHYADATSYHIEAVEERTLSNELSRDWQKTLLTAIVMPGGRYRYEGRSAYGGAILVSDGTTRWDYHLTEHVYTQQPVSLTDLNQHRIISPEEGPTVTAQSLVREMFSRPGRLKAASFLPDETISLDGRNIECYVVRFSEEDFKTKIGDNKQESTLWIEKSRKLVRRAYRRGDGFVQIGQSARIPIHRETTVTYPVVELDQQEPAGSFSFVAPAEAKLVTEFPELAHLPKEVDLTGKPAPELQLKSSDGKVTTLSSMHGKPVFLEFWATWCGPCVALMPDLTKLYAETQGKGLVWMSVDSDDDSSAAAEFISREHIPWPNYHDEDGSLGKAFGRFGIPLGVLIDAEGKVTFYESGYEISELRTAIAKLGPQFSSVALVGANQK